MIYSFQFTWCKHMYKQTGCRYYKLQIKNKITLILGRTLDYESHNTLTAFSFFFFFCMWCLASFTEHNHKYQVMLHGCWYAYNFLPHDGISHVAIFPAHVSRCILLNPAERILNLFWLPPTDETLLIMDSFNDLIMVSKMLMYPFSSFSTWKVWV